MLRWSEGLCRHGPCACSAAAIARGGSSADRLAKHALLRTSFMSEQSICLQCFSGLSQLDIRGALQRGLNPSPAYAEMRMTECCKTPRWI